MEVAENFIKTSGRDKGSRNTIPRKIKEFISDILKDNLPDLQRDIDELDPKDRLMFLERLISYIVAKPKAIEVEVPKTGDEENEDAMQKLMDAMGSS